MRGVILSVLLRIYALLLRTYPRDFRAKFADEMLAVFTQSLEHAGTQGAGSFVGASLRELWHAPWVLLRMHWFSWGKKWRRIGNAVTGLLPPSSTAYRDVAPDGRDSWMQAGLEASSFVAIGTILIVLTYLPLNWSGSAWRPEFGDLAAMFALLSLPGLLFGLSHDLPRWAYPFFGILFGYVLLFAIQFKLVPFLGASLLGFLMLSIVAVAVHFRYRPLPPVWAHFGRSIWADWTRLSFGVYGLMPLLVAFVFDDARFNNRTPYLAISVLVMISGALAYCRSRQPAQQIAALLSGMSCSVWMVLLDQAFFEGGVRAWVSAPGFWSAELSWMLKVWASIAVLMMAPLAIGMLQATLKRVDTHT